MPKHVRCTSCDTKLLSTAATGPSPLRWDDCPNCGERTFEFVE